MDQLFNFFNQGWVGSLIGAMGVLFAIYQIMRKSEAKPVFQYYGQRLISSGGGLLPNEVSVQFGGEPVPRISLTNIVFWNNGSSTIKGADISQDDPIIFEFKSGDILKTEIVRCTRDAVNASTSICDHNNSKLQIAFAFLDADDGFLIRVLHTSNNTEPEFSGTIMGIPRGIKSLGKTSHRMRMAIDDENKSFAKRFVHYILGSPNFVLFTTTMMGAFMVLMAVRPAFLNDLLAPINQETIITRYVMAVIGILYFVMGLDLWHRNRRRFPATILDDG